MSKVEKSQEMLPVIRSRTEKQSQRDIEASEEDSEARPTGKKSQNQSKSPPDSQKLFYRRSTPRNPSDSRRLTRSLPLFIVVGLLAMILPFVLLRYVLRWETLCFNEDLDNPKPECEENKYNAGILISQFITLFSMTFGLYYCFTIPMNPDTPDCPISVRSWAIISTVIAALSCYMGSESSQQFLTLPLFCFATFIVWKDYPNFNRGGLKLGFTWVTSFSLTWLLTQYASPYLDDEIALGFKWSAMVPIVIQFKQGLIVFAAEKLSQQCHINSNNSDAFIALSKEIMITLATLKFGILLHVLKGDNPYPTLIFSVVSESLGRAQIWRSLLRRAKTKIFRKKYRRSLRKLTEMVVCAEYDADYYPILSLVTMKVFQTPFLSLPFAVYHAQNSYMDLKPSAFVNPPWVHIAILLITTFASDLLTYVIFRAIQQPLRLYKMKIIFLRSRRDAVMFSLLAFPTAVLWFLQIGQLFEKQFLSV